MNETLADKLSEQKAAYQGDEERPLGPYMALMGTYGAAVSAAALVLRRRRQPLPERVGLGDLALVGLATHKMSRLLTRDSITSPLRAPFTRFEGAAGEGELNEQVRGDGARKAVGELITCPFCVAQWVATGFVFGLVLAPRATRLGASIFSVVAMADYLQFAHAAVQKRA